MNEKEKESVEEFKKQLRLAMNIDDIATTIRNGYAQIILNLLEKLQKENETLKLKYQLLYNKEVETLKEQELKMPSLFISKQKIKDKIEKLRQEDKEWTEELSESDGNFKIIDRNLKRIKNQIDVLQELMKEREEK